MLTKADGITVLICTHNGEKNIPETLKHLALQKNSENINWDILLVDNACTDNTVQTALQIWSDLQSPVPLAIINEPEPGKDRAVDLGLKLAKYKYVIICDDDNWLDDTYIQNAYSIMNKNPKIGILGGKGIAEFGGSVPTWFNTYRIYYAVGEQSTMNGEISHYWPTYQFLWGAGAVINMNAYHNLQINGFERILSSRKYPKVARSEDVELCFAIWLSGYKVWYNEGLTYKHFIPQEKLDWQKMHKIIRYSNAAMHYLRPYNILLFTGSKHAPQKSFWQDYITYFLKAILQEFRTIDDLKTLLKIILGKHKTDPRYFKKTTALYQFYDALKLGIGYDRIFNEIKQLQKKLTPPANIE